MDLFEHNAPGSKEKQRTIILQSPYRHFDARRQSVQHQVGRCHTWRAVFGSLDGGPGGGGGVTCDAAGGIDFSAVWFGLLRFVGLGIRAWFGSERPCGRTSPTQRGSAHIHRCPSVLIFECGSSLPPLTRRVLFIRDFPPFNLQRSCSGHTKHDCLRYAYRSDMRC